MVQLVLLALDLHNDADGDAATKYEVKTNLMVINLVTIEKNFYANGAVELPANEIDIFGLKDILVL